MTVHLFRFINFAGLLDYEDLLDETRGDAWDSGHDPIVLDHTPREETNSLDLVVTENKVFNKTMFVFVALCQEMSKLKEDAETSFYGPLLLYAEGDDTPPETEGGGDEQLAISRFLPFVQRLYVFVMRIQKVVKNVMHQLGAVYSSRPSSQIIDMKNLHLETVFSHLGDTLVILVTLDEIIAADPAIIDHWTQYKRMMKSVRSNPTMFGVDKDKLPDFEHWILDLESQLLDGLILQNCMEQNFDEETVGVTSNTVFREEFTVTLRCMHAYLEPRLAESNESNHREQFVGLCALFVFHFRLFRVVDKRLVKALWDVQRKLPAVHLYGDVILTPNEFLVRKIPTITTVIDRKHTDFNKVRREYLAKLDENAVHFAQEKFLEVWLCKWVMDVTCGI